MISAKSRVILARLARSSRGTVQRAFDRGEAPDLTKEDIARLLEGLSAHSTWIGPTRYLLSASEDIEGIIHGLRWRSARIPLACNHSLAAKAGAAQF